MKKIIKEAIGIFLIVLFSVGTLVFSCYLLHEKDLVFLFVLTASAGCAIVFALCRIGEEYCKK